MMGFIFGQILLNVMTFIFNLIESFVSLGFIKITRSSIAFNFLEIINFLSLL